MQGFTDAAGGSMAKWGNGIGAFLPPENWVYITYGFKINGPGVDETGNFVCRKKSVWELCGPLLFLCRMPYRLFGKQLIIWVDNCGSVMMIVKGYSTKCNLCCTLLVAINKTSGRSDTGAKAADHLSKSALSSYKAIIPGDIVPQALLSWLTDPVPDRFLGRKIVKQMVKSFSLIEH